MQTFTTLIMSRFQNINPEEEGKTVNGLAHVKNELQLITIDNKHFSLWKGFFTSSRGTTVESSLNPDTRDMYKEDKPFTLSAKI